MSDALPPEAPDADRYEQALDAVRGEAAAADEPGIDIEVPEADAVEQSLPGPPLDEDEAPR